MGGLGVFFAAVPDPRSGNARHDLSEILFIAFAAVLCGAETCVDMAEFGAAKADLLGSVLALKHGIPSHDTFSRLFRLLDPEPFEAAFRRFMERFAEALSGQAGLGGQTIALDGKSLRGAVDRARRTQPLHLVTAW
ncbi:ISAs1 family transposase, partial [Pseudomonas pharyngis]